MPRRATYKCPKCDSKNIVPIIYGMPGMDLREEEIKGKIQLGGCCIEEDAPDRHCNDCEHQWKTTDKYNPSIHQKYEYKEEENKVCTHCLEPPMYCKCYEYLIDDEEIRRKMENKKGDNYDKK